MAGLLDFLQGASNSAASNVSAPVDGLAWLLRKAGLPIPSNPVGGSDWMAQQGFTREPQNRNAGLLGEAIGGVLPIVAAAKAPQIAKGLLQVEANAMAPQTLNKETGAIVWHGSPHKFDKFDASKIGSTTDEGMLGQGHYFTTDGESLPSRYANTYKVDADIKNPLNISMPNFKTNKRDLILDALGLPKSATAAEITKAAKSRGFDSVNLDYSPTGYMHQEIAAFPGVNLQILPR